ncbi:DB domain-containing protein [Aphelenchoides besseyi]|nr:DB domain-containing protein [Aphelenchoides besseyi]
MNRDKLQHQASRVEETEQEKTNRLSKDKLRHQDSRSNESHQQKADRLSEQKERQKNVRFCAAQGQDHRACCHRQGVANTLAGPKCLVFCDQRPNQVTQLDLTYLPCFERFNEMKTCFWNSFNFYKSRRP